MNAQNNGNFNEIVDTESSTRSSKANVWEGPSYEDRVFALLSMMERMPQL